MGSSVDLALMRQVLLSSLGKVRSDVSALDNATFATGVTLLYIGLQDVAGAIRAAQEEDSGDGC